MLELLLASGQQVGGSVESLVVMFGGNRNGSLYLAIDHYNLNTDVLTSPVALASADSRSDGAACGNRTLGIYGASAGQGATTRKYIYATKTHAPGTNISYTPSGQTNACGNLTSGLFAGGNVGGSSSALTSRYKYSDNTVAAKTNLDVARRYTSAAGNADIGVIARGVNAAGSIVATSSVYTHATETASAGTTFSTTGQATLGSMSTSSTGYWAGGTSPSTAAVVKYNFSSHAVSTGGALSTTRSNQTGGNDAVRGIWAGGMVALTVVDKYEIASELTTTGTALTQGRHNLLTTATTPGWS